MKTAMIVGLVILLVLAALCVVPMVALWCINSLAEAGGSGFYIPHTAWNYVMTFVLLILVNGSAGTSSGK